MKRFSIALIVLTVVIAFGAAGYASTKSNTGCGVGTMIFEGKDGLISQLCATVTNGIFGNQTFGITSGTLGCEAFNSIASNQKVELFIAHNMDNLVNDISEGNGEYINTLAVLLEIPEENRNEFYTTMQANFSKIFTSADVTSKEVTKNINTIIQKG